MAADINVTLTEPQTLAVTVTKAADITVAFPGTQGPSGEIALADHVAEANPHDQYKLNDLAKTFNRDVDGNLLSIEDEYGTKTFVRDVDGVLLQIVGTGVYRTKTFNRNPDGSLASITVS